MIENKSSPNKKIYTIFMKFILFIKESHKIIAKLKTVT